ncbi:1-acyl-sn-glycerol-3-phosphate acyltransferase [Formivibrio citricus]|uniref:1-acyl-sn-glycerol-3-phosphate acyltransferase n=2 Tax=Formivibrio citricus TaxID=83765 RepID=A0A1I4XTT7_9NEIS|nr:1-acyl-sn-glycerol-3-phosphate acyltransferase [Formivibrio citricus]
MYRVRHKFSASLRRGVRLAALGVHVAAGLGIARWLFPRYPEARRKRSIHRWSRQLLRIVGLRLAVHGQAAPADKPILLLSNHVSWLDIYALNAISPARFVAKSEVRSWPVIGTLCTRTGTLFVDRNSKHDARRVNTEIAQALQGGSDVALFPEGTTTDGSAIRPFRSALLQAAMESRALVQPVYLRYLDAGGSPTTLPAYCDDISFGQSLWRLLGARGLRAEVHFLPPLRAEDIDRRELARTAETLIRERHERLREAS